MRFGFAFQAGQDSGWASVPRFGGGPSGSTTSTSTTQPWAGQEPYLMAGFQNASTLLNNPSDWPQYFPSNTYAQVTPQQWSTLNQQYNVGMGGGTPALQAEQAYIPSVLSPGYTQMTSTGGEIGESGLMGNENLNYAYAPANSIYAGVNAEAPAMYSAPLGEFGSIYNEAPGMFAAPTSDFSSIYSSAPGMYAPSNADLSSIYGSAPGAFQPSNSDLSSIYNNAGKTLAPSNSVFGALSKNAAASLYNPASGALSGYLSGAYLNPFNAPGFQTVVGNTLASVMPAINSQFAAGGRDDSGMARSEETQGATNAVGGLALSNYQTEQGLQQQAAQQAANIAAQEQQGIETGAAGLQSGELGQLSAEQAAAMGLQQGAAEQLAAQQAAAMGLQQGATSQLAAQNAAAAGLTNTAAAQLAAQNAAAQGQTNTIAAQLQDQIAAGQGLSQNATNQVSLENQADQALMSNYLNQQQMQNSAAAMAPFADQSVFSDYNAAMGLGNTAQQNQQAQLNALINQWNYNQALPWNVQNMYQGLVGNNYGSASTMTQPYYQNTAANVLGTGLGLAGIGKLLFGGL